MGKFNCDLAEELYRKSLAGGWTDDEIGSVDELGWFAIFREEKAILSEDELGFVDVVEYATEEIMENAWQLIVDSYTEFWRNVDGD